MQLHYTSGCQDALQYPKAFLKRVSNIPLSVDFNKIFLVEPSLQHNHDQAEKDLLAKLFEAQIQLHAALCDSFDTPTALEILCDLVSTANVYINSRPSISNTDPLEAVALWVTRILRIFGLGEGPGTSLNGKDQIGWGELSADESSTVNVRSSYHMHADTLTGLLSARCDPNALLGRAI